MSSSYYLDQLILAYKSLNLDTIINIIFILALVFVIKKHQKVYYLNVIFILKLNNIQNVITSYECLCITFKV